MKRHLGAEQGPTVSPYQSSCTSSSNTGFESNKKVRPYVPKRLRTKQGDSCAIKQEGTEYYQNSNISNCNLANITETTDNSNITTSQPESFVPSRERYILRPHDKPVTCVRHNESLPDIACSSSLDGRVGLLNLKNRVIDSYINHTEGVKDVRWDKQGVNILCGGFNKHVSIHDVKSGQGVIKLDLKEYVTSVLYHPDNEHLFLAGMFKSGIVAADSRSNKVVRRYKTQTGQIHDLLFLPDKQTFLSAAEIQRRQCIDKAITCWDFDSGATFSNQIYQDPFPCTALRLHPDGSEFLTQSGAGYIAIFSTVRPYRLNKYKRFEGHQTAGYRIGFSISPDGKLVASGDNNGHIHIYDYKSSKLRKSVELQRGTVITDVSFHPTATGTFLASTWDGTIAVWD